MRQSLQSLCELFMENREIVKSAFSWENAYIYPICAAIFTDKRRRADADMLRQCRELLKEETGIFSNFRGAAKAATISMLAVSPSPEDKLNRAILIYSALKERFFASQYLPAASMIIADIAAPEQYEEIVARTRSIYELMKDEHPILTSAEDSVYAVLLALSRHTDEQIVEETERCYELLKPEFFSGNAVQSLSHVLALGEGAAEDKCGKTLELYRQLRDNGCKYGTSYELATLGVLALLPSEQSGTIVEDIVDADAWLEEQSGYGFFGVGKKQRLMHAGMLVTGDLIGDGSSLMGSAAIGATISLIVAQQAAMCAAIAASSAASASASSGGN